MSHENTSHNENAPEQVRTAESPNGTRVTWYSDGSREVELAGESSEALQAYLEGAAVEFEKQFGRPMGDDDPLFWDEDADEPKPMTEEKMTKRMSSLLRQAGMREETIFAYEKTGLMLTEENESLADPQVVPWWYDEASLYLEVVEEGLDLAAGRLAEQAEELLDLVGRGAPAFEILVRMKDDLGAADCRVAAAVLGLCAEHISAQASRETVEKVLYWSHRELGRQVPEHLWKAWLDGNFELDLPSDRLAMPVAFLTAAYRYGLHTHDVLESAGDSVVRLTRSVLELDFGEVAA